MLIFIAVPLIICSIITYAIFSKSGTVASIDDLSVTSKNELVNADGSTSIINPIEQEIWIVDKQFDIMNLLERQNYISVATVVLSRSASSDASLTFSIVLDGIDLHNKVDEILSLVAQNPDNIDMDNSYIMDIAGDYIYNGA
jgi:hypothetical protein